MLNRTSMFWTILVAALALTMVGCLPSSDGGGNNGSGEGINLNNGGGNNGGSGSCQSGDDCPIIYCNCTDDGVVNASRCDNNSCAPADEICPDACAQFGSEWNGTVSDIPERDAGLTEDGGITTDTGQTEDTGTFEDAGSDGPQCLDGDLEDTACGNCMDQNCCSEIESCFNSESCTGFLSCLQNGGTESTCASENPGGQSLLDSLVACQESFCSAECQ